MRPVIGLALCTILLAALAAAAQSTSTLRAAFNTALNSLATSGKFATFANKYGLNPVKPACPSASSSYPIATGLLKDIIDSGSITFCQSYSYAIPFWNTSSNTGFLIDIITGILDEWKTQYGRKITPLYFVVPEKYGFFVDLQMAVNNGSCHAVADVVTVTAARSTLVDFSCSYTTTTSGFLRGPLEAFRTNLTTLASLNDPSVKVGILRGSIYDSPSGGVSKAQRILFSGDDTGLAAVANQEVHATLSEAPSINNWLISNPCNGCKYYEDGKGTQDYAFFVTTEKITSAAVIIGNSLVLLFLVIFVIVFAI